MQDGGSRELGGEPTDGGVLGSLDKAMIRAIIHSHRSEIRFCYEDALTSHPNLGGKIAVRFVIDSDGRVQSSKAVQSTVDNAEFESCVAARVLTWQFPKPKGGGVVVVTYPFLFKPSAE